MHYAANYLHTNKHIIKTEKILLRTYRLSNNIKDFYGTIQGDCREETRRAYKIHISALNGPFE